MDAAFITFACDILADTDTGLSGTKIVENCVAASVDYNVRIPCDTYPFPKNIPNKRTALKQNLLAFTAEQRFAIIRGLCELPKFSGNEQVADLKVKLFSRYGHLSNAEKISDSELVMKTKHWLDKFPDSLDLYNKALLKYESSFFNRNTLDDIRLSFEMLVKALLGNNRSLENQIADIGKLLKDKNVSPELRNMITQLITYYTQYQNTYIKHNDAVNENEIEYVIEFTSLIMKILIKMLN